MHVVEFPGEVPVFPLCPITPIAPITQITKKVATLFTAAHRRPRIGLPPNQDFRGAVGEKEEWRCYSR